jgi:glutathione S-transferase
MSENYILYGGELSYFTRKLEAALIFYGADFEFRAKTNDNRELLEMRSGTHQVPVLQTPENWLIADTTPIMTLLDNRFPDRAMFPQGKLGVLVHLLEEYFDEWIARTMVHYRWHYPNSAEFAANRMAAGNPEAAARVLTWGPKACRATGTDSQRQRQAAEDEYVRILETMEKQLTLSPYLLGGRPTALDCVVLGGLRAHTNMDPDPKIIVANYPRVVAWAEASADNWSGQGDLCDFDSPTLFGQFILEEMAQTYQPYALGNKAALRVGAKAFHAEIYAEQVSYLCRPYIEKSRQMLESRINNQLTISERDSVLSWLNHHQLNSFNNDWLQKSDLI